MKQNKTFIIWLIILICIGVIISVSIVLKKINKKSKIKDGIEIIYKVERSDGSKISEDDMNSTNKILEHIISEFDYSQYNINKKQDKIYIKFQNLKNIKDVRKKLSIEPHYLTFRDINDNIIMDSSVLHVNGAQISQDSNGNYTILLSVKDKNKFYTATTKLSKQKDNLMVIWLDYNDNEDSYKLEESKCGTSGSKCLSVAQVSQGFSTDVIIEGNFTFEEVENLVDLINYGMVKTTEVSFKKIHYINDSTPTI